MTPTQRKLITDLIVAELKALTAGASRADVNAELDRRRQALRNRTR